MSARIQLLHSTCWPLDATKTNTLCPIPDLSFQILTVACLSEYLFLAGLMQVR